MLWSTIFYGLAFLKNSLSAFIMSKPVSQGRTVAATLSRPLAMCLSRPKFRRGNTKSVSRSRSVGQKSFTPSPTYAMTSYLTSDLRQCSSRIWPLHMLTWLKLHQSWWWYGNSCKQPELSNDAGFVYTLLNTECRPAVSSMCSITACTHTFHSTINININKLILKY